MKLKAYILSMVAVSMFFSCSDNDPIDPTKPNATLSLLTDASSLTTKADDGITSLGVAIVYGDGQVMTGFGAPTNGDELLNTEVKGGTAKVIVFANLDATTVNGFKVASGGSVENILNTLWALDKETDGKFSMSSKVYDVSIVPGKKNAMGFGSTPSEGRVSIHDALIKLYRNVSRVQVGSITLQEDTKYGKAQYFKLNSIFMANVKSKTQIGNTEAWGKVEVVPFTTAADWWYGAFASETGTYKGIAGGTVKESLLKYTPVSDVKLGLWDTNLEIFASTWTPAAKQEPFFHVYENQSADKAAMTYLIICGDYTLLENGVKVEYTNRYWAVAINPDGTGNTTDYGTDGLNAGITTATQIELLAHKGIRRNHIYSLVLTLSGRGSDKPYTPDATINLNAEVVVNPWSELVNVPGGVE